VFYKGNSFITLYLEFLRKTDGDPLLLPIHFPGHLAATHPTSSFPFSLLGLTKWIKTLLVKLVDHKAIKDINRLEIDPYSLGMG
jgi:hypothetical protein